LHSRVPKWFAMQQFFAEQKLLGSANNQGMTQGLAWYTGRFSEDELVDTLVSFCDGKIMSFLIF